MTNTFVGDGEIKRSDEQMKEAKNCRYCFDFSGV